MTRIYFESNLDDTSAGHLEDIPLPADSVDVVISNCVINLAADKQLVLREAAREDRTPASARAA